VLANYKTEPCKKPPRLCRQGYACPQFHNNKDRRRSPRKYKYRSTPCPAVKTADEWGDPVNCDSGDGCQYCHTRWAPRFRVQCAACNPPVRGSEGEFAGPSSSSTRRFTSRPSVTTSRTRATARAAPSVHSPTKNVSAPAYGRCRVLSVMGCRVRPVQSGAYLGHGGVAIPPEGPAGPD
jgi:hypothetical protein